MKKKVAILGSTGSIGCNTLDVVQHLGFSVTALAARANIDLLEEQARKFSPELIAVFDGEKAEELQRRLSHIKIVSGIEGLIEVARFSKSDIVVSAMSGTIGIIPTIEAIEAKKDVAIANKEALVSAGSLIMNLAKKHGVNVLPVDSEHSAIFQCLEGRDPSTVHRLILTASGGPFLHHTLDQLANISLEEALNHPTWRMGLKNTIDSSTLMNKGLEVIEARWLFDIPREKIDVVIHPQSVIHSMVEFVDGSMLAQLSDPDMRLPIQYALTYPERGTAIRPPFDLRRMRNLELIPVDTEKFRCLNLAYKAIEEGMSAPCFLNAANEVLVQRFAQREIGWLDMQHKLEKLLERHSVTPVLNIDEIIEIDTLARKEALQIL